MNLYIGYTITFYVVVLYDDGLYVVAELNQINLPSSVSELHDFVSQQSLDKLLDMYKTLQNISPNLNFEQWQLFHRITLDTPSFKSVISKTRSS